MNVILNTDEVHVVLTLVSSQVLDSVDISDAAKRRIRSWRSEHDIGTLGLDEFAERVNEALGNEIDERTTRFVRKRGKVRITSRAEVD